MILNPKKSVLTVEKSLSLSGPNTNTQTHTNTCTCLYSFHNARFSRWAKNFSHILWKTHQFHVRYIFRLFAISRVRSSRSRNHSLHWQYMAANADSSKMEKANHSDILLEGRNDSIRNFYLQIHHLDFLSFCASSSCIVFFRLYFSRFFVYSPFYLPLFVCRWKQFIESHTKDTR